MNQTPTLIRHRILKRPGRQFLRAEAIGEAGQPVKFKPRPRLYWFSWSSPGWERILNKALMKAT